MSTNPKVAGLRPRRGQAIVLVGPQGCGKSTAARHIAQKAGRYEELSGHESLKDVLLREPDTLIVEETEAMTRTRLAELKELITVTHTTVRAPYSEQLHTVRTPNLIFCSCDPNWLRSSNDRRFFIVRL